MIPTNILQQVQTYNMSNLAFLENYACFLSNANTKFKNFNTDFPANLGDTITFDLPPQYVTANGLVVPLQPSTQRVLSLVCDQAKNIGYAFTDQQFIFNVREYMQRFGKAAIVQLGTTIEGNLAQNCNSSVPVMTINSDGESVPTGALHTESGPYRFFGDGINDLSSQQQLAQMLMLYRNYGAVLDDDVKVFLADSSIPAIISSMANQFVPARNERAVASWDLGTLPFDNARFYRSNILPIQNAGTVGNEGRTLTLVSTNDPTGQNVTQLTFSDPTTTDADSFKAGDLIQFQDGVGSFTNQRYLTFTGYFPSKNPVQCRVIANAATATNSVTITISKPLIWANIAGQNLNVPLQAGMQIKALPTHRCGAIVGGNSFYVAMPKLPTLRPYDTASETDKTTGVSLRTYYGSVIFQNQRGMAHDCVFGSVMVPEYSMRIVLPV